MHGTIFLKTLLIYVVNTNCLKVCLQRHQYLTRDSIRVPWTRKHSHTTELTTRIYLLYIVYENLPKECLDTEGLSVNVLRRMVTDCGSSLLGLLGGRFSVYVPLRRQFSRMV